MLLWLTILLSLLLQQIQNTFTRSQFYGNNHNNGHFKLIRIHARGFLPFEQDILPYAVISGILEQQQMQLQRKQRLERKLPPWMLRTSVQGYMSSQLPPLHVSQRQIRQIKPAHKEVLYSPNYIRLEHKPSDAKRYRIYDGDDGERLLDLRIHRHATNNRERGSGDAAEDGSLYRNENKWKVSAPPPPLNATPKKKKIVQHYFLHLE